MKMAMKTYKIDKEKWEIFSPPMNDEKLWKDRHV